MIARAETFEEGRTMPPNATLDTVVVYRLGSLGDTIVALPCFHKIAQTFPNARRLLLTNIPVSTKAAPAKSIIGASGLIHDFISYPVGTRSASTLWRLSKEIRALKIDTMIYLMPARGRLNAFRDWLFFRFCGIRKIIGLPNTPDLQNNRIDAATGFLERECERLARTLSALGPIDLTISTSWDLLLTEDELNVGDRTIAELNRPFIAINMGGKVTENDWGAERWLEFIKRLSSIYEKYGLLIVGAAEDSERARRVAYNWRGSVVDACGKLMPRETAAAMRSARVFVGHDSGPLHLAATMGVPCLGLFSAHNKPAKWHPYSQKHRAIHNMSGMSAITVDEVVQAVAGMIAA
ncbi:glycosyltransferase family 9 protein [Bradyrhizobium canariense]|uniref:glycosyltransferase family 9 protein n=1 Tax=Bradyrhizobium canariense TaxID=255045 RepID=UPI001CA4FA26|nr:glycosyltransferase family 9 protein [Bradyrhizobium canariense]MBW5438809.1 glycosyltransferase family 9 protein [Bradyrhizobium canariense]